MFNSNNYTDHWFTQQIADYVSDDNSRAEDIAWLLSEGLTLVELGGQDALVIANKEAFFHNAYERFKVLAVCASALTLSDFCGIEAGALLFEVASCYRDKFGFYVDEDGDLMTLDTWVRIAEVNTPYYIGGTVDYHF